jgi:putative transposase
MLTVIDEYTREALCVAVRPKMNANDVLDVLFDLILKRGKPRFIRSDNGPEFIAEHLQTWLGKVSIEPIQIYPGSPWENGYNERFNGTLRNKVLNVEWFHTVHQAQTAINVWLRQYNHIRSHRGLNMRPPVPETLVEKTKISGTENWD